MLFPRLGILQNCGTVDIPPAQIKQIIADLPPDPTVSGSSPVKIPIWFFRLRTALGQTVTADYDIESALPELNEYFDGIFEFTLCGSTVIDSDAFWDLDVDTEADSLNTYVNQLYQPTVNHCLKVFQVGGFANSPYSGYAHSRFLYNEKGAVYVIGPDTKNLAHEIGHYFTLPHTFIGGQNAQYVDSIVVINGIKYTCHDLGDLFCDTPADNQFVTVLENGVCVATSTGVDLLGKPYHPDPTLLMSYGGDCRNRFTTEQVIQMRTFYNNHEHYSALKNIPAVCAIPKGIIVRECSDATGFVYPIVELPVGISQISQAPCSDTTNTAGRYNTNLCSWPHSRRSILPNLNYSNPLNGVTTYDLVLISKHILGIEPLGSPFKLIAADANYSGSITTFDIVTIRKVILGINLAFPYASWRYVPHLALNTQSFNNAFFQDPFTATYIDPFNGFTRTYGNGQDSLALPNNTRWIDHVNIVTSDPLALVDNSWSFTGIKVGDVNCSAISEGEMLVPPPNLPDVPFGNEINSSITFTQGQTKTVQIIAESPEEIVAWQFGASFPPTAMQILGIVSGNIPGIFDADNFHMANALSPQGKSTLKAIWYSEDGNPININGKALFGLNIQANAAISSLENTLKLSPNALNIKFFNSDGNEVPVSLKLHALSSTPLNKMEPFQNEAKCLSQVMAGPNPMMDNTHFAFDLATDQTVKISIIDTKGQVITQLQKSLKPGSHELIIPEMNNCYPGLFYYSIEAGPDRIVGKLMKI